MMLMSAFMMLRMFQFMIACHCTKNRSIQELWKQFEKFHLWAKMLWPIVVECWYQLWRILPRDDHSSRYTKECSNNVEMFQKECKTSNSKPLNIWNTNRVFYPEFKVHATLMVLLEQKKRKLSFMLFSNEKKIIWTRPWFGHRKTEQNTIQNNF